MPPGPCMACVAEVVEHRASHNGCEGGLDGICALDEPMVTKWCVYCLLGEASKALLAARSGSLNDLVAEFISYWTTDRTPDGCGMCGGRPHSTTCFVGRMARLLEVAKP